MAEMYSIPEQAYEGMKQLSTLSDAQFISLVDAVKQFQPSIYHSRTLQNLISKSTGIGDDQAQVIRDLLGGLSLVYSQVSHSVDDFWNGYFEELVVEGVNHGLTSDDFQRLMDRLPEVIGNEAIILSASAVRAVSELPAQYSSASTSVELRPIFFPNSSDPKAFVIVSSLKLQSFNNDDSPSVSITLDELDIENLMEELEELKARMSALKVVARQTSIPLIPINDRRRD